MIKKSLQRQILVPFLLLILMTGIVISCVGYFFSMKTTVDNSSADTSARMVDMNESLDRFLYNNSQFVLAYADDAWIKLYKKGDTPDYILSKFQDYQISNESIVNSYFVSKDNGVVMYPVPASKVEDLTTADWYQKSKENPEKIIWVDPFVDKSTGRLVVKAVKGIENNGEFVGVAAIDIAVSDILTLMQNVKIGDSGYALLIDNTGSYMVHPNPKMTGKSAVNESFYKNMEHKQGILTNKLDGEERVISYVQNETTGWKLVGTVAVSEFERKASVILLPIGIALLITLFVAAVISVLVSRKITKPVRTLKEAMNGMENGNLQVTVSIDREDEIGDLADSFTKMSEQMRNLIGEMAQITDHVTDASQTVVASAEENSAAASEVSRTMQQIAEGSSYQAELMEGNVHAAGVLADRISQVQEKGEAIEKATKQMNQASVEGVKKVTFLKEKSLLTTEMTREMTIL
ncbi:methyl-accepting chemotaxis protein [Fictibacillus barbaricus]|uniref:Methyl-accepting chemotaxis protein n=1 Tax=Fictibacillus barbaricus TaxID=182136 RepID=A0ABU1U252_9BACL|nr:methyl-accepting chemotaxis protein [Fictibacillus barbaricus]MDR7073441.1 methyl-accepting chemotaxis protein [Fictibacillus barbaricus]